MGHQTGLETISSPRVASASYSLDKLDNNWRIFSPGTGAAAMLDQYEHNLDQNFVHRKRKVKLKALEESKTKGNENGNKWK